MTTSIEGTDSGVDYSRWTGEVTDWLPSRPEYESLPTGLDSLLPERKTRYVAATRLNPLVYSPAVGGVHEYRYDILALKTTFNLDVGNLSKQFIPIAPEGKLLNRAWDAATRIENPEVAHETRRMLLSFEETIQSLEGHFDISCLPPLQGFNVEDGSFAIEWVFNDFRIGFSVETNTKESGWFLVSNNNLGEISASGYISGGRLESLFFWLASFAVLNS